MNRQLGWATVFAAITLLWNLYGFAGNFFEHYWGGSQRPVVLISYLANALLLVALTAIAVKQARAALFLAFAGLVMGLWSLGGVAIELGMSLGELTRGVDNPPLNLPEPPPALGALLPMATGFLTAMFAWNSRRRR